MLVLQKIALFALAAVVAVMTYRAWRAGVVTWRGGAVAATREDNPGLFWLIIGLQTFAGVSIVGMALA